MAVHHVTDGSRSPSGRSFLQLSRHSARWAVAFAFLAVSAFSTVPSSLYALYDRRDHLSPLTITVVYAVYAAGIVISLLLAGHLSDLYGRRAVLLPAVAVAVAAAVVFLTWTSLPGLLVARVLTGLAVGGVVATATAFIADLDAGPDGIPSRRAGIVSTAANVGGLACGPLIAGLIARYTVHGLTLPFIIFLVLLLAALAMVGLTPETRAAVHPRPKYRPQRISAPAHARGPFMAAVTGAFASFAVGGLFAGLTGTLLAASFHHSNPALTGLAIFLTFGAGVLVQTTTTHWSAHHLVAVGIVLVLAGLCLLVASVWTSPPRLALFLVSSLVAGAGQGAVLRGSLSVAISITGPEDRAGTLAAFFTAGYLGVSLPVVGAGLLEQHLGPRVTLLIFALGIGIGFVAAARVLVRPTSAPARAPLPLPLPAGRSGPVRDHMTALCPGFGARVDAATGGPAPEPSSSEESRRTDVTHTQESKS
ncbi:MFS transporter [Streptomyces sp. NPDC046821]|uniref:MFS transporter n=1 Tax=Streptomyces sp. NPDC046821 TaxID=3154702 RepID=UPI0033EDA9BA